MKEIWKDIKGYEGIYQVSDLGRVRSLKFGKERILVGRKDSDGYLRVGLCKDGKEKTCRVHRLVAEAFIPNPDGLPQVNHKDERKSNNVASNLEWCDCKYNINYGMRTERISKTVYQYTLDSSLVGSYPSVREAGRRTGYSKSHISDCCRGERKQAYGFVWSYTLSIPKGRLF